MKHQLSLEVPETANEKIFRVLDSSVYVDNMTITCAYLQITAPGFTSPVQIEVAPNYNMTLTACALGLQSEDCLEDMACLPDGIYKLQYSVSPSDKLYVEYNFLRETSVLNSYFKELAKLELKGCDTEECFKDQLKDLGLIKSLLDAAKAKVEYTNEPEDGMDLFLFAKKKLRTYTTSCCH